MILIDQEKELQALREFIATKKPHVIAVSAESREALYLVEDIKAIVAELESEKRTLAISVELVDAELAHTYSNSKKAEVSNANYLHIFWYSMARGPDLLICKYQVDQKLPVPHQVGRPQTGHVR